MNRMHPEDSPKRVALLVGGWSAEREVSLTKGRSVAEGLRQAGYDVCVMDVTRDLPALCAALVAPDGTPLFDVVFNNLYGQGGEDGVIQGILEMLGIPYTHSGVAASAVGMDKPLAKRIAASMGVPTPQWQEICVKHIKKDQEHQKQIRLPLPYVIKPACEGSSVGVHLVLDSASAGRPDSEVFPFTGRFLVESFVAGRELTVAVLDGVPQAVTEIIPNAGFFDYRSKYHDSRTAYVLPAVLPQGVESAALAYAERVYSALGCRGLARCDFRYDDSQTGADGLFFLEINTQPGLTPESIGPSQVVYRGLSFSDLCAHLVETATCHVREHEEAISTPDDPARPAKRVSS